MTQKRNENRQSNGQKSSQILTDFCSLDGMVRRSTFAWLFEWVFDNDHEAAMAMMRTAFSALPENERKTIIENI